MRRRIFLAYVGLTVMTIVLFATPLAIVVGQRQAEQDRRELTILATRAADRIPTDFNGRAAPTFPRGEPGQTFGLYSADGTRRAGQGPPRLERLGIAAADDRIVDLITDSERVVTVPVVDNNKVVGLIRASEPLSGGAARVHQTWALVGALAAFVLLIAGAIAVIVTRRVSQPLEKLRDDAQRIGDGDFTVTPRHSGIREIDDVGSTLSRTATRIGDLLEREEAFSADASHQLRTPLTGLRLTLENELASPGPDPRVAIHDALDDVERVEKTVTGLLALAREVVPASRPPIDLRDVVRACARRWRDEVTARDRLLVTHLCEDRVTASVSRVAVEHVLDVLADNAVHHGKGRIDIGVEVRGDLAVITCADEGRRPVGPQLFERRSDTAAGNGIGLALARRLAEAEGGRLQLSSRSPSTSFELMIRTD